MTGARRRVVIFAVDGLKASVFKQYVFQRNGNGPADSFLRRLARGPDDGGFFYISVEKTKSIFPSYTIPAWASIFTGNYPNKTGIVGNSAYYRDLNVKRKYDAFEGGDAIHLYGWDWNVSAFPEIGCEVVTAFVLVPDLFRKVLEALEDACITIWKPPCWGLHPGWPKFWPHKECILDFYDSGGIQNGDLLTPTLYDYAKQHGYSTYVVHQFYNRTMRQAANWDEVYGGDIKNIDISWGRPTFRDIRGWKSPEPDDNRLFDERAFDKARRKVQSQQLPSILTVYTAAIDLETHKFRTYSYYSVDEAQLSGLAFMDRKITELVKEIERADPQGFKDILFFLIADHGLTENDTSKSIDSAIYFPGEIFPGFFYIIKDNSYMAHLYIRSGQTWSNIPTSGEIEAFMKNVLPFATFGAGSRKLIDYVAFFVTRERQVYRNWNGTTWEVFPLSALDDREYGFVDGARRIEALLHRYRAGDVIIVPKRSDRPGKNTGFSSSDSTHGSLWPEDTYVPFYVWGEPLNEALKESGSVRLKEGSIVDLTPTVMSYLDIYGSHASEMDGRPLFDKDFNINLQDFEILEESTLLWEVIFGRMVLEGFMTK